MATYHGLTKMKRHIAEAALYMPLATTSFTESVPHRFDSGKYVEAMQTKIQIVLGSRLNCVPNAIEDSTQLDCVQRSVFCAFSHTCDNMNFASASFLAQEVATVRHPVVT